MTGISSEKKEHEKIIADQEIDHVLGTIDLFYDNWDRQIQEINAAGVRALNQLNDLVTGIKEKEKNPTRKNAYIPDVPLYRAIGILTLLDLHQDIIYEDIPIASDSMAFYVENTDGVMDQPSSSFLITYMELVNGLEKPRVETFYSFLLYRISRYGKTDFDA